MPLAFPYRIDRTGRSATPQDVEEQVRQMLEQILFTAPGERVCRPTFGTGAHQLVFEPAGPELQAATQHLIRGALQQWLADWIEVHDVGVEVSDSTVEITLRYVLRSTGEQRRATFSQERPS